MRLLVLLAASASGQVVRPQTLSAVEGGAVGLARGAARVLFTGYTVASEPGPLAVTLGAPVPNLAGSQATVSFTLPEAGPVTLRVVDALGREVAVVLDRTLPPGETACR